MVALICIGNMADANAGDEDRTLRERTDSPDNETNGDYKRKDADSAPQLAEEHHDHDRSKNELECSRDINRLSAERHRESKTGATVEGGVEEMKDPTSYNYNSGKEETRIIEREDADDEQTLVQSDIDDDTKHCTRDEQENASATGNQPAAADIVQNGNARRDAVTAIVGDGNVVNKDDDDDDVTNGLTPTCTESQTLQHAAPRDEEHSEPDEREQDRDVTSAVEVEKHEKCQNDATELASTKNITEESGAANMCDLQIQQSVAAKEKDDNEHQLPKSNKRQYDASHSAEQMKENSATRSTDHEDGSVAEQCGENHPATTENNDLSLSQHNVDVNESAVNTSRPATCQNSGGEITEVQGEIENVVGDSECDKRVTDADAVNNKVMSEKCGNNDATESVRGDGQEAASDTRKYEDAEHNDGHDDAMNMNMNILREKDDRLEVDKRELEDAAELAKQIHCVTALKDRNCEDGNAADQCEESRKQQVDSDNGAAVHTPLKVSDTTEATCSKTDEKKTEQDEQEPSSKESFEPDSTVLSGLIDHQCHDSEIFQDNGRKTQTARNTNESDDMAKDETSECSTGDKIAYNSGVERNDSSNQVTPTVDSGEDNSSASGIAESLLTETMGENITTDTTDGEIKSDTKGEGKPTDSGHEEQNKADIDAAKISTNTATVDGAKDACWTDNIQASEIGESGDQTRRELTPRDETVSAAQSSTDTGIAIRCLL